MNKPVSLVIGVLIFILGMTGSLQANSNCGDWLSGEYFKNAIPNDIIQCLNDQGNLIESKTPGGLTALHFAAGNSNSPEVINILIGAGANMELKSSEGFTPLHIAVAHNTNPKITRALLDAGANIESKAELGLTPLHSAAAYNTNHEIIEVLLQAGAVIDSKIVLIGWSPLHAAAAYNGNPKIIETLLDAGANPQKPDAQGRTPFDLLIENNNLPADSDIHVRLSEGQ